ncbi:sensor histidine kinase [Enterovibrio paralichthyis]|uniref:sensor histidine kinase n=1 Tax=Enterovibrio paralichthyis TaxID=2853805 RepID=UPI001C48AE4C|nr:ATP-binding protein [Enterovibrio paralichthyis]MBV7297215.1 HAMP domain-containing histidine kinase [Enterovibrio paralichthyis]
MKQRASVWFNRHFSPARISAMLPRWAKSSATQQGMMFGAVSLISLVLMASVTYFYVEHELKSQNREIVKETRELAQGHQKEIDDDPIDDEDILTVLMSGFVLAGVLVSLFTVALIVAMSRHSQKRITRIEQVLAQAAEGDLSARTGERYTVNDLAQISVSLDDMLSRLQGSVAAMSDISANIAHELKTPITRLRHNLLTLKEEADEMGSQCSDSFLNEMENALNDSQRLASIFDALLRISQIKSGARRARFSQIDLTAVVATVAEIYEDVADDAGMLLTVEKPDSPLWLQGDRELLIQQVANLIENALRYCPAGSTIRLRCGGNPTDGAVWLDVTDNGPGIPESEKARVFERLYRVDKSRTDGGLGLGLSLAKAVAGLHHGDIRLEDAHPGLRVRVTMPGAQ